MPITTIVRKVANGWRASRPSEPSKRLRVALEEDGEGVRQRHAADRGEPALLDVHAAHAEALEQVDVVGRDQHRDADRVESLEQVHDLEREVGIEVAGRLVGDQDGRLRDDRARDADALLFPGGQLEREGALAAEQPDLVERRAHALVHFAPRHAADRERQGDVVIDGPVVEQPVVLEHDPDLAAEGRNRAAAERPRIACR